MKIFGEKKYYVAFFLLSSVKFVTMVLTYDKQNLRIPFKILKKKSSSQKIKLTIKKNKTISTISKRSISISLPVKDSNKFRL